MKTGQENRLVKRSRIRVLIVDDDVVDRMACRRAISENADLDAELLEADTGREGVRLARELAPDCILLDYGLPDLNGLEFLAEIRQAPGLPRLPVLMLTGADSATIAVEAMRRGAWDYLWKDVDGHYLTLLTPAIQHILRERRLADDKQQAEAKYRTLVEQIPAITYLVSVEPSHDIVYISPQINLLGFTPEQWATDPEFHFRQIHPEDRHKAERAIHASRATYTPLQIEYRLKNHDGEFLWFRDEAKVVRDDVNRMLFFQGILLDINSSKHTEHALRQSQYQLRQLAGHLESVKEEERKRIARELHDELGGLLTGIKAYVSVYARRNTPDGALPDPLLTDAGNLIDNAIEAVRRVITDLRPSVLDQLGIWAALEWYTEQIQQRSGLTCECMIEPSAMSLTLDPQRSTMLFRIAQESLTNVVKHAEATRLALHARYEDGVLTVEIADDGKGIHPSELAALTDSWGILGMHERSRYFGGDLKITGTPGGGTVVVLRLPVETS